MVQLELLGGGRATRQPHRFAQLDLSDGQGVGQILVLDFAAFVQQVLARVDVLEELSARRHGLIIQPLQRTFELSRSEFFDASLEVYVLHFALNRRVVRIFAAESHIVVFVRHDHQGLSRRVLRVPHSVSTGRNFYVHDLVSENAAKIFVNGLF